MPEVRSLSPSIDDAMRGDGAGIRTLSPRAQRAALLRRGIPFLVVLIALAGAGILANDYGQSYDDHGDARFGAASLRAYIGDPGFMQEHGDRLRYGPFSWMVSHAVVALAQRIAPGVLSPDVRHIVNASFFVWATVASYWLAVRLTGRASAALLSTLLFALQPVVLGHAFINQKDTPFMALFVLSVAAGIAAVDFSRRDPPGAISAQTSGVAITPPPPRRPSTSRRVTLVAIALLVAVLIVDLLIRGALYRTLSNMLALAYTQQGPFWLSRLFRAAAEDSYKTPLELYVQKLVLVYGWASVIASLILLAALAVLAYRLLPSLRTPTSRRRVGELLVIAAAGIPLGLCMSTRAPGGFAGVLVVVYALLRPRWRSTIDVVVYLAAAAVTSYLTWPFLWSAPVSNLLEAVHLVMDFPARGVLFEYIHYASTDLPRRYLPRLLEIQLTETALLAFAVGLGVAVHRLYHRHITRDLVLIAMAWLFLPLLYVVLARPSIYGNFRQFLFILPPLFLLAGLAIDLLFSRVRHWPLRVVLAALLLAPGLLGIARLHPYEYVYYNSLVGGTRGAVDRFQLDNWCTSYRAAMEYVNQHAPAGAVVAVGEPVESARTFARPDLRVVQAPAHGQPDFALICDEQLRMDNFYPDMSTVQAISADGVALAEVKRTAERAPAPEGSP